MNLGWCSIIQHSADSWMGSQGGSGGKRAAETPPTGPGPGRRPRRSGGTCSGCRWPGAEGNYRRDRHHLPQNKGTHGYRIEKQLQPFGVGPPFGPLGGLLVGNQRHWLRLRRVALGYATGRQDDGADKTVLKRLQKPWVGHNRPGPAVGDEDLIEAQKARGSWPGGRRRAAGFTPPKKNPCPPNHSFGSKKRQIL